MSSSQVVVAAVEAEAPLHLEVAAAVVPHHPLQSLQAELLLVVVGPDLHRSVQAHLLLEVWLL